MQVFKDFSKELRYFQTFNKSVQAWEKIFEIAEKFPNSHNCTTFRMPLDPDESRVQHVNDLKMLLF